MQHSPKSASAAHGVKIRTVLVKQTKHLVSALQQLLLNSDSPQLFQIRVGTGEKMVQIQLPEQEKPLEEEERRDVESGRGAEEQQQQQQGEAPLLSTSLHIPLPRERRQTTNKG